jgi:NhaP-type Na+/H+ or K+/H+ antiporter
MLFGILAKQVREEFLRAAEGNGDTLALITWVIFGAAIVGQAAGHFNWQIWLYAILSLTIIRMLPVFLVLTGMGVSTEGKLFMGWFGPRGLASIVFAVIVVEAKVPNSGIIAATAVCTIMLSIVAHGITANPWAKGFGERFAKRSGGPHPGD